MYTNVGMIHTKYLKQLEIQLYFVIFTLLKGKKCNFHCNRVVIGCQRQNVEAGTVLHFNSFTAVEVQNVESGTSFQRYIAGSIKCSTKPQSLLLTKLLTDIKESLQRY
jgi:hypothetical protein